VMKEIRPVRLSCLFAATVIGIAFVGHAPIALAQTSASTPGGTAPSTTKPGSPDDYRIAYAKGVTLKEMANRRQIPCSGSRTQALPVKRRKELANMLVLNLVERQLGLKKKSSKLLQIAPIADDAIGGQTPFDSGVIQKVGKFRRNVGE